MKDVPTTLWIDGEIAPRSAWSIEPDAEGVLYGRGLFETTRLWNGRPWLWDRHLARLLRSATEIGLKITQNRLPQEEEVADWMGGAEGVVRLNVLARQREEPALVWMSARPMPAPRASVRLMVAEQRVDSRDAWASHKSMNYLARHRAYELAASQGFDDAVLVSHEGEVLETAHGNIFIRKEGEWRTPPAKGGLLPGTVRAALLDHAPLRLVEKKVTLAELAQCEVVALANSVRGAEEVTHLAGVWDRAPAGLQELREAISAIEPAR